MSGSFRQEETADLLLALVVSPASHIPKLEWGNAGIPPCAGARPSAVKVRSHSVVNPLSDSV